MTAHTLADIRRRTLAQLVPPPKISLGDWAERNVALPDDSAMPGRIRLCPPQHGICEAISGVEIERVSVLKAARVGFTILLNSTIASYAINEPSPVIFLQPTAEDSRDAMIELENLFDASPALRGVLAADADEGLRNTITYRKFPGGSLRAIAARSPRALRRITARILCADECDAYEPTAEGDALATKRTLTFSNRKLIVGSSPIARRS
jgi:phage terminase large subunit GpA-like protein